MNNLMLLVVLGVAFVYCGGSNVPAVFRNNKQLLGGVVVGLFLCSFFGLRLEGVENDGGVEKDEDEDAKPGTPGNLVSSCLAGCNDEQIKEACEDKVEWAMDKIDKYKDKVEWAMDKIDECEKHLKETRSKVDDKQVAPAAADTAIGAAAANRSFLDVIKGWF